MRYEQVVTARFLDRPNRFVAHVDLGGTLETVHVKNTGRCAELLLPGAEVWLAPGKNPNRKTRFDLVAVRKDSGLLVNIDSQAPNQAAAEWLAGQGLDRVLPEYRYGDSRIDFYLEKGEIRCLLEVKGCTLEREGIGYFPDAPTERGVKHLRELSRAAREGWRAFLVFIIQMDGVTEVRPNLETHPEFGLALDDAEAAGVSVLPLPCHVEPEGFAVLPGEMLNIES